jgi:UDP-N-acetylmuramoyl-L-alanyl-D-glutamate--2,6-diaminopimelate ligase
MHTVTLGELAAALDSRQTLNGAPVAIADLAYDTRAVSRGALFFCLRGAHVDGHSLASAAAAAGAAALVVEQPVDVALPQLVVADCRAAMAPAAKLFFGDPTSELEVAGVTGTNGKTTTAFLLHAILTAAGRRAGPPASSARPG